MRYVILRPDETASLVDDPTGHEGTVIEVADDFNWRLNRPDWATLTVVPTLDVLRAEKWSGIKVERDARRVVAPTSAGTFDCDETGRSNILGMLQAIDYLGAGVPEPITWKMHDNSFQDFTRDGFKAAALEVLAHIQGCYATSFQLEAQISAAATVQDVEAVAWPE